MQSRIGTQKETLATGADRSAAIQAVPPPGSALLFVRRTGFVGKLVGINLLLDGKHFAQLRSPRFTSLVISPGSHTLSATGSAASPMNLNRPANVQFHADPGEIVLFDLSLSIGALKGSYLLVRNSAAREALVELRSTPMVVAIHIEELPTSAPQVHARAQKSL